MNGNLFTENEFGDGAEDTQLTRKLARQSENIERVMAQHRVPTQVNDGLLRPDVVSFRLREQLEVGLVRLRDLAEEIKSVMGVGHARPDRLAGNLQISMPDEEDVPLTLMDMLQIVTDLPAVTAILGESEDGRPVLLDLSSRDLPHVLIAGETGAGKTSLLRTIAVSLALTNRQSEVQLVIMAATAEGSRSSYAALEPCSYLPHMLSSVAYGPDDAYKVLAFLVSENAYRREQGIAAPALVVMIDGADELMEQGGTALSDLISQLIQQGAETGIHLVLGIEFPEKELLDEHFKAGLPVRVVGKLSDKRAANIAAGVRAQADYLRGRGEFAAVMSENSITYFQAAFVGNYDVHNFLEMLHRTRVNILLARPIDLDALQSKSRADDSERENDVREFFFDGKSVVWRQNGEDVADGGLRETQSEEPPPAEVF